MSQKFQSPAGLKVRLGWCDVVAAELPVKRLCCGRGAEYSGYLPTQFQTPHAANHR